MCDLAEPGGLLFQFNLNLGGAACCGFLLLAGAFAALILIIRQAARSNINRLSVNRPGTRPPLRFQQPRIVDDGFWLHDPRFLPGSVVRYRYRTGGQTRTGTHRIQPGPQGQFIYTGDQPEDIEILDVMPADAPTAGAVDDWDEPDEPTAPASSVPTALPADDGGDDSAPAGDSPPSDDASEPGSSGADFPAAY
jgi:hypothetical protein